MNRILVLLGALALLAFASPLSAFSAGNGSVSARVLAGLAPCITITSPPTAAGVDFGNLPFSPQSSSAFVEGSGTPDISVSSCATASETLFASGTAATDPSLPNTTWNLTTAMPAQCSANFINTYRLGLRTGTTDQFLTTANQTVTALAASASVTRTPRITMPCAGSSGNGATMTMTYNFTTTVP